MVIVGVLILLAVLYGIHAVVDELIAIKAEVTDAAHLLRKLNGHAQTEADRVHALARMRGTGRELLAQRLAARLEARK